MLYKNNNCFRQKCVKAQSHLRFPANENMCEISRKFTFILANFFAKMNFSEFFWKEKQQNIRQFRERKSAKISLLSVSRKISFSLFVFIAKQINFRIFLKNWMWKKCEIFSEIKNFPIELVFLVTLLSLLTFLHIYEFLAENMRDSIEIIQSSVQPRKLNYFNPLNH